MTAELVKKWLISGLRRFCSKTQWQMFLLVSGRHVGAHPDEHGVSIQTSIILDEALLRIARELKTAETWFLARLFILQSSIISQILKFNYWTVTIFSFDHMTDENQEYLKTLQRGNVGVKSVGTKVNIWEKCT